MARKLPSFQFYPGDWQKEPNLRCVSHASKGVFIDMLCLMFECERRGVLATNGVPWTDEQVAAAIGGTESETIASIAELLAMNVVSRNNAGAIISRRMVRDENERQANAKRQSTYRKRNGRSNGEVTRKVTPQCEGEGEDEAEAQKNKNEWRPPTASDVEAYAFTIGFAALNSESFCDHYASNGWMVGQNPMVDWKATVRKWKENGWGVKSGGSVELPKLGGIRDDDGNDIPKLGGDG